MADVDLLLKPREAAATLGVNYMTLKQRILAGTLTTTEISHLGKATLESL